MRSLFQSIARKSLILALLFVGLMSFGQSKWDLKFYTETVGREYFLYADNGELMPMSVKFTFKLENLKNTLPDNSIVVVPPKTKKMLVAKLTPINLKQGNRFSYSNTFNFGDVTITKYDDNFVYDLPYPSGKSYSIYQGYNGKFSHSGKSALDFGLKTGDPVHAARGGIVVEAVGEFNQGCPNISCAKYNNKILIMHSDGTFADYVHLKQNGVLVKPGDEVEKGQLIGYSGNTGFTSGPHLHFSVFINGLSGEQNFIKTKFKTTSGDVYLQEKQSYTKK